MRKANTGVQAEAKSGLTKLLTTPEVAELLRVEIRMLENWRSARKGPPFIKVGVLVRYRVVDLEAWLEKQTMKTEFQLV